MLRRSVLPLLLAWFLRCVRGFRMSAADAAGRFCGEKGASISVPGQDNICLATLTNGKKLGRAYLVLCAARREVAVMAVRPGADHTKGHTRPHNQAGRVVTSSSLFSLSLLITSKRMILNVLICDT